VSFHRGVGALGTVPLTSSILIGNNTVFLLASQTGVFFLVGIDTCGVLFIVTGVAIHRGTIVNQPSNTVSLPGLTGVGVGVVVVFVAIDI
jgi:hypothetical protein